MAFMFGQPGGFWSSMQSAWPSWGQSSPRNMQGPMGWGQQHSYFSPFQASGMYPYAPSFGYSSPFMGYGSGLSYFMPPGLGMGYRGFGVGGGTLLSPSAPPSPAPPYGSYPGLMPGFGLKPAGAPYDVDQTGQVTSNQPQAPATPTPQAAPQAMRFSPLVGRMLPVNQQGAFALNWDEAQRQGISAMDWTLARKYSPWRGREEQDNMFSY